ISSLSSSAHTYRLLIFKERRVSNVSFVSRLNQERPNYGFPRLCRQVLFEKFLKHFFGKRWSRGSTGLQPVA
ncbi:hypothetical protein OEJ37_33845, partial [Burkholderia sp. BKH01]|uniref:hypothetical protein n=1 Tax=Burkholderia sp. BKH01 TaxID=2769262 RepID=UPI0021DF8EC5